MLQRPRVSAIFEFEDAGKTQFTFAEGLYQLTFLDAQPSFSLGQTTSSSQSTLLGVLVQIPEGGMQRSHFGSNLLQETL